MNWQAINFDWNQIRAFYAAAEEGSLSAGARALGLTQPTLSRQVTALEARLGVTLFERVGKGLVLTQAGQNVLEHVRCMGVAAMGASRAASVQSTQIQGEVKISASDVTAAYVLPPVLADIRDKAPALQLTVVATNALSNLEHREADIAIRHVRPTQSSLFARRLPDDSAYFYAAQSYLKARGAPRRYSEATSHDFIAYESPQEMIRHFETLGLNITPRQFVVGSSSGIAAWLYATKGLGISAMTTAVAKASTGVSRVFEEEAPMEVPMWLTTHRELHTAPKIRFVFDALAQAFGGKPQALS